MNNDEFEAIFNNLKNMNLIHPEREIQVHNNLFRISPFQANLHSRKIEYDPRFLQYYDKNGIIFCLLHEEGHLTQKNQFNEFDADQKSVDGFWVIDLSLKSYEIQKTVFDSFTRIRRHASISQFQRFKNNFYLHFEKICLKINGTTIPSQTERLEAVKKLYEEKMKSGK